MEKTCKLCGVTKPLTRLNFEDNDGYRDGFQNQCRQCRNAVRRARALQRSQEGSCATAVHP